MKHFKAWSKCLALAALLALAGGAITRKSGNPDVAVQMGVETSACPAVSSTTPGLACYTPAGALQCWSGTAWGSCNTISGITATADCTGLTDAVTGTPCFDTDYDPDLCSPGIHERTGPHHRRSSASIFHFRDRPAHPRGRQAPPGIRSQ